MTGIRFIALAATAMILIQAGAYPVGDKRMIQSQKAKRSGPAQMQVSGQVSVQGQASGTVNTVYLQHKTQLQDLHVEDFKAVKAPSSGGDFKQAIESLSKSSYAWNDLPTPEAKAAAVAYFIDDYKRSGITISKEPAYYAEMIDAMALQNPSMLKNPFNAVIQTIAILEYDFGNGQDPDALARRVMSPEAYENNKRRLGK